MATYIGRRAIQAVVSLLGVSLLIFILSRATGDPTVTMLPPEASDLEREALTRSLGLDRSYVVQYFTYLTNVLTGDFGVSLRLRRPVLDLILSRVPNSLILAAVAITFSTVLGTVIGVIAAYRPGSFFDRLTFGFALLGQSVPTFWVGILGSLIFAIQLGWFPSSGFNAGWRSIVLPAFTLGWFSTAAIARVARSATIEALSSHFVTVARSKGLSEFQVVGVHALRNSLLSVLTVGSMQFVLLLNGAVVTEKIFNWPGIGSLLVDAAFARDFPLVQALVIFAAMIVITVNLLTDLLYGVVDPRVRLS
jgi:peptide/nickel transport system permease protein